MIFSALRIFLVVLLSESINGLISNFLNPFVLLFWVGSNKQLWNNSNADLWSSVCVYYFHVRSQILKRITHSKILPKFEIISKLPSVKCWACLLELPGTEFEGSVVQISGTVWWWYSGQQWLTRVVLKVQKSRKITLYPKS